MPRQIVGTGKVWQQVNKAKWSELEGEGGSMRVVNWGCWDRFQAQLYALVVVLPGLFQGNRLIDTHGAGKTKGNK